MNLMTMFKRGIQPNSSIHVEEVVRYKALGMGLDLEQAKLIWGISLQT